MSTLQTTCSADGRASSSSRTSRFWSALRRLPLAYRVHQERRALMSLSDATLKDIGMSRADVYREAARPWWQVPDNR